jgi:hypothetical protein
MNHAVSSVTHTPLLTSGYAPAGEPHSLSFAGPRALPMPGARGWHLALVLQAEGEARAPTYLMN